MFLIASLQQHVFGLQKDCKDFEAWLFATHIHYVSQLHGKPPPLPPGDQLSCAAYALVQSACVYDLLAVLLFGRISTRLMKHTKHTVSDTLVVQLILSVRERSVNSMHPAANKTLRGLWSYCVGCAEHDEGMQKI